MNLFESMLPETLRFLESRSREIPRIAIVCGSGLGSLVDLLENPVSIPYEEIPHFRPTNVQGHQGKLCLGRIASVPVAILQGRIHRYEGHSLADVVFPLRALIKRGVKTVILTNASGGIRTSFRAGDLMLIEDHVNLTGENVLTGPNLNAHGPRFPDLTKAWDPDSLRALRSAAEEEGIPVQEGVYIGLPGPTYETRAEVRMLRTMGGDACGMSTVQECIAASHFGARVAGISCITNLAAGIDASVLAHEDVLEIGRISSERAKRLLARAIPRLDALGGAGK